MDEKLLAEIFAEEHEVPAELRAAVHEKLLRQEKAIMRKNIAATLAAVFSFSFFLSAFAVIFFGNIVFLLVTAVFSAVSVFMAVILAGAASKYDISNAEKGIM